MNLNEKCLASYVEGGPVYIPVSACLLAGLLSERNERTQVHLFQQRPASSRQDAVHVKSTARSSRTAPSVPHVQRSWTVYVWLWCTSSSPRDDAVETNEGE